MNHNHHTAVRRGLPAAVAVGALAIGLGAGPAAGQSGTAPGDPATIEMAFSPKKGPYFRGAKQVAEGAQLRIRNTTAVRQIGPHTITFVTAPLQPKTKRAFKRCFTPRHICLRAAKAHQFNPKTEKVNRPLFKTGQDGWDKSFNRNQSSKGDTWYTQKKGETFSQVVSAKAGTTLRYMCVVHPEMQGKIDITQGAAAPTP